MDSADDFHNLRALLEWQVELGATEAIGDAPVDRYALDAKPPRAKTLAAADLPQQQAEDPVAKARMLAQHAASLEALEAGMSSFEGCDLKKGARNLVFADGNPNARLMIVGEAPGRDEDIQGRPFVGRAGQLLDKMLAAIGMARDAVDAEQSVYITNVLPWRPPQNRDPKPDEIGMMLPFVQRHVELVGPDVLVVMGNISCQAFLGKRGITRLRGEWTQAMGLPVLPMFHPAYLLRQPAQKRLAWADLLEIQAKLRGIS